MIWSQWIYRPQIHERSQWPHKTEEAIFNSDIIYYEGTIDTEPVHLQAAALWTLTQNDHRNYFFRKKNGRQHKPIACA